MDRHAPQGRCTMKAFANAVIAMAAALTASACGDDVEAPSRENVAKRAVLPHQEKWLDIKSTVSPAQWVVSWREEKMRPMSDPEVEKARRHLDTAHALYRESERMIANRAVQLEQMLGELDVKDSAANILEDLSALAGEVGLTEGFGALSQHYYILRSGGYERTAALALLRERYGRKTPARSEAPTSVLP